MKVLFIATVRSHIGQFHMPLIKRLKAQGWIVDAAYHDNSAEKPGLDLSEIDTVYEVPFERSPFNHNNILAYRTLKKIIDEGNYAVVHCNTPVGAVLGRLAAKKSRNKGTKVIYTAHGFHFFKGSSLKNWMLFYPIEKYLSKFTDLLITINDEDYNLALKKKFKAKKIVKVNGVGVDFTKFSVASPEEKECLRNEYGYSQDTFIMMYAADLSIRKNQQMLIRALSSVKDNIPNTKLLLPGQPILKKEYENLCNELGISDMVEFLGYRRDIDRLLALCDCVVSSAKQEGLPINLIEAAARGKYIIATDVRGNSDVVKQYGYGTTIDIKNVHAMSESFVRASNMYRNVCVEAAAKVSIYDQNNVVSDMMSLYADILKDVQ